MLDNSRCIIDQKVTVNTCTSQGLVLAGYVQPPLVRSGLGMTHCFPAERNCENMCDCNLELMGLIA